MSKVDNFKLKFIFIDNANTHLVEVFEFNDNILSYMFWIKKLNLHALTNIWLFELYFNKFKFIYNLIGIKVNWVSQYVIIWYNSNDFESRT